MIDTWLLTSVAGLQLCQHNCVVWKWSFLVHNLKSQALQSLFKKPPRREADVEQKYKQEEEIFDIFLY